MSTWRYGQFLQLSVRHSYYRDGAGYDWNWVPSVATQQLLASRKLRCKADGAGLGSPLRVFGELNDQGGLPTLPAGGRLTFFLVLRNAAVMGYTDAESLGVGAPARYSQVPGAEALQRAPGQPGPELDAIYAEAGRVGARMIVDLQAGPGNPLMGRRLHVPLAAKQGPWTYFIALQGYGSQDEYAVQDSVSSVSFSEVSLGIDPQSAEGSYRSALVGQYPTARILVFRSASPIAWTEAGRTGLKLVNVTNGNAELVSNLPAPSSSGWVPLALIKESGVPVEEGFIS
ncbi:MAG: hypothetical protein U0176_12760 [Bacteroidia bacterium]